MSSFLGEGDRNFIDYYHELFEIFEIWMHKLRYTANIIINLSLFWKWVLVASKDCSELGIPEIRTILSNPQHPQKLTFENPQGLKNTDIPVLYSPRFIFLHKDRSRRNVRKSKVKHICLVGKIKIESSLLCFQNFLHKMCWCVVLSVVVALFLKRRKLPTFGIN